MRTPLRGILAIVTLLFCVAPSAAGPIGGTGFTYDGSLTGSDIRNDQYTVGNQFSSTNSLVVNALGAQDISLTGAVGTDAFGANGIQVGLWTNTGTLLATATVTAADPAVAGGYRYAHLSTPVVLLANTPYLIGALVGNGIPWGDSGSGSAYHGSLPLSVTMSEAAVAFSSSLAAPLSNGGGEGGRWAPANFQTVPEPSSFILCGLGAVGLFLAARRRRKA